VLLSLLASFGCDEAPAPGGDGDQVDEREEAGLQLHDLGHGLGLAWWAVSERPMGDDAEAVAADEGDAVEIRFTARLKVSGHVPRAIMVSVASRDDATSVLDAHIRFPAGSGFATIEALDGFRIRQERGVPFDPGALTFRALDRFGGDLDRPTTATGRFRVEEIDGRHWFVTPDGHAFFSAGVNHTTWHGDYSPPIDRRPYHEAVLERYGDEETWADATVDRILGWSLNTIGAWSSGSVEARMPHTIVLSMDRAAPEIPGWPAGQTGQKIRDFFDPTFLTNLPGRAEGARRCAEDPNCIGVYSNNEMPLGRGVLQIGSYVDAYLTLPPGVPGKLALQAFFEDRYTGDIDAMNAVWSLGLASFEDIQALESVEDDDEFCAADQRRADRQAFVAHAASRYYEGVHDVFRAISPDMLILGSRLLAVYTAPSIYEAAAPWVDVISINDYDWDDNGRGLFKSEGEPYGYLFLDDPVSDLDTVHALTGRPIMITEWTYRGPTPGTDILFPPFIPTVETQAERADRYEAFMRELLDRPYMVGSHWFKFHDQPITGRGDGENSRFGTVNIGDDPYPELTERMAAVGASIYAAPSTPEMPAASHADLADTLGRRVLTPSAVQDERTGFFVFILPGVNLANELVSDPLLLDAGAPDELGVAPLSLAEDATLAYVSVVGDIACVRLRAEGSHGELSCEGGFPHDVRSTLATGVPAGPPAVETFLGTDAGPGAATLFTPFQFVQLPAGAVAHDCWTTDAYQAAYEAALTTATATSIKGGGSFDTLGESFVCGADGAGWRTQDGPGMLAIPVPLYDGRARRRPGLVVPRGGQRGGLPLAVRRVVEVEAAARVPIRALVAVSGDATGILQHAGHVQQVPGHEGGVAVGEVVLRAARPGVEVGGPGPGLTEPAGVGLGRDDVAQVLERVEHVHRAVLGAVLVAGDECTSDAPVVGVLSGGVQQAGGRVQTLDHVGAHRGLLAEPDRGADHQDVGGHHLLEELRPLVALPAVLLHVRLHAIGDLVIHGTNQLGRHAVLLHDVS
jgi:hypothetical protein